MEQHFYLHRKEEKRKNNSVLVPQGQSSHFWQPARGIWTIWTFWATLEGTNSFPGDWKPNSLPEVHYYAKLAECGSTLEPKAGEHTPSQVPKSCVDYRDSSLYREVPQAHSYVNGGWKIVHLRYLPQESCSSI